MRKYIVAAVLAALVLCGAAFLPEAGALSSDEIQQQIDALNRDSQSLSQQIAALEKDMAAKTLQMQDLISRKESLDQQIALLHRQVQTASETLAAYKLLLADKQAELDRAQEKLEEMNQLCKARIRAMEEQGDISYWSVIFKAKSFPDLLDRLQMVTDIARSDSRRLEQLRQGAQDVEEARSRMASEKLEMEKTQASLLEARSALEEKRTEAEQLLAQLVARGEEYEAYMEEAESKQESLMDALLEAQEAYDKAKYEEWLASLDPGSATPPTPGNEVDGRVWYTPTKNFRISSKFGPRVHPITGEVNKMHKGVDMAAPKGTPIYATRSGVVTVASFEEGGAGYYVKINHNDGYQSIYMHMTHYIVKKGDHVAAGQIIGYVGSTGGSTGPHLHFGISKYNSKKGTWSYVDPLDYIKV